MGLGRVKRGDISEPRTADVINQSPAIGQRIGKNAAAHQELAHIADVFMDFDPGRAFRGDMKMLDAEQVEAWSRMACQNSWLSTPSSTSCCRG
jgi:hypothetical protein